MKDKDLPLLIQARVTDIHRCDGYYRRSSTLIGVTILILFEYPSMVKGYHNVYAEMSSSVLWNKCDDPNKRCNVRFWAVKYIDVGHLELIKELEDKGISLSEYIL